MGLTCQFLAEISLWVKVGLCFAKMLDIFSLVGDYDHPFGDFACYTIQLTLSISVYGRDLDITKL